MRKIIAALFLALFATSAHAWDQKPNQPPAACAVETPYGVPQLNRPGNTIECHTAYMLQHDQNAKIPAWVAWKLTPDQALGCVKRSDAFVADNILPKGQRAEVADYAGTGFDKGHLANDGDMSWDQQVEYESFLMSNMSPQYPAINRGIWKLLESATRAWAWSTKHTFVVYAGDIWNANDPTIGPSKVVVPDHLYKIAIDTNTNQVYAFIFPNENKNEGNDLTPFMVSVADVEKATGTVFGVPQGWNKAMANKALPATDFKSVADAKAAKCKG